MRRCDWPSLHGLTVESRPSRPRHDNQLREIFNTFFTRPHDIWQLERPFWGFMACCTSLSSSTPTSMTLRNSHRQQQVDCTKG